MRRRSVPQAEVAAREQEARSVSEGSDIPAASSGRSREPRRGCTRGVLSGGRRGLVVKASTIPGAGLGLFAGPEGISPGGFIALHMGAWEWIGGSDRAYEGSSAYAMEWDDWRLVTPLREGVGGTARYHAARINEPAPGTRANSFARTWTGAGQLLSGGVKAVCMAMHAGAQGVAPGEEITWCYGGL